MIYQSPEGTISNRTGRQSQNMIVQTNRVTPEHQFFLLLLGPSKPQEGQQDLPEE
jgi:hypothetical protein